MLARTHLIRIQRTLYDRLKGHARGLLGGLSPELKKYFLEYQKDFHHFDEVSTKQELLVALQKADLVFCGDYHTLSQAQRTVIRLLRDSIPALKQRNRKLILALEMVSSRHNRVIEQYLKGKLTEREFLKSIGFDRNWGFDWANYCALFHFAKKHGVGVVGVNLTPAKRAATLRQRDEHAAKEIVRLSRQEKTALIFVLIGDLHLAEAHLPRAVEGALKKAKLPREKLVIHQNNDRFYWKLVEQGLEQKVEVVKMKAGVFCVLNTPPWLKLQSHLRWNELVTSGERPSLDALSPRAQYANIFTEIDFTDEAKELMGTVRKFFDLPDQGEDRFRVCGPLDQKFLRQREKESAFSEQEAQSLEAYLTEFKSHFIPRLNVIFLTTLSSNHAATQSAICLHSLLSGFGRVFLSPYEDFYTFLWVEALGYLGSKVINPKRKCNGPSDLLRFVETEKNARSKKQQGDRKVARWVLEHYENEQRWLAGKAGSFSMLLPLGVVPRPRRVFYYKAAKLLGHLLGEALYTGLVNGNIERHAVRRLFLNGDALTDRRSAKLLYTKWIAKLDRWEYRRVKKAERL